MVAKHGGAAGGITKKGWEEAERLFRKAIEIDPQLAHFYLIDLGFAPSVEAGSSKMVEATEKAVQLDPNDGEAHLALGNAYRAARDIRVTDQDFAELDRAFPRPLSCYEGDLA